MAVVPRSLEQELAEAVRDPRLIEAGSALHANDLPVAERLLKAHLRERPDDVAALRMLAELAARLRRYADAEALLARALNLRPDFRAARLNYASVLQRGEKIEEATREAERLLVEDPDDLQALAVAAAIHVRRGDFERALSLYQRILDRSPDQPRLWLSYGHVLKTIGRRTEAIAAYRQALDRSPTLGDGWWSLANLKTYNFEPTDILSMTAALANAGSIDDQIHLNFALGKALEDAGQFEPSFARYREGNALRRSMLDYEADALTGLVNASTQRFDACVFAERAGGGEPSSDPIFIVGLPRSGSTLVEQILASHSAVEGTAELPHIPAIVRQLADGRGDDDPRYIDVLLRLSPEERTELGRQYLQRSALQRKSSRPRFIDKLPNNFAHIGLIKLILPNATIIDTRRHAIATCFSCYKQHFARGQEFTYDLGEIAIYYRDYRRLMAHYERVLPGTVHRVEHEQLIDRPEEQIRALLTACGLSFESACLNFHRTERPVRTASSEQVRRPLNRDAVDQWRNFSPWLGRLIDTLGD
jgi:tetratricopeptide (TPR) repeat protein